MNLSAPAVAVLAVWLLTAALSVVAARDMKRFLAETPVLQSAADLDRLKRVAARNMYGALIMLAVAAGVVVLLAVAVTTGWTDWNEVAGVLCVSSALLIGPGVWVKSIEARVKAVPAADPDLRAERDRVVKIWWTKALPRW
jgi:hypothetical protein